MKKVIVVTLLLTISGAAWYSQSSDKEGSVLYRTGKNAVENKEAEEILEGALNKEEDILKSGNVETEIEQTLETLGERGAGEGEMTETSAGEAELTEKYKNQFLALRDEYGGKLDALAGAAKAEYMQLPKDQRQEAALLLGAKYLAKGNALEGECDARFNAILGRMQAELEVNGLSLGEVQAAAEAYQSQKNTRRDVLLNEVIKSGQ